MSSSIFHNNKKIIDKSEKINFPHGKHVNKEFIVDMNKLLNRVKNNEYEERKSKIIFFSIGILLLASTGLIISIIR